MSYEPDNEIQQISTTGPERKLGIDDERELRFCGVLCRNYWEGINALTNMGPWDVLYLDHDLSSYHDGCEFTGYDIMCFLEENTHLLPKKIELVTANPAGRKRMEMIIKKLYGE